MEGSRLYSGDDVDCGVDEVEPALSIRGSLYCDAHVDYGVKQV